MGKRHKPEEIIGKLREAEIVLAQGVTVAQEARPATSRAAGRRRSRKFIESSELAGSALS